MTKRLQTIISMISPDSRGVIDVGTDHGYVPVTLAKNGFPGRIIATDINPEPLQAARRLAEEEGTTESIDFRLTDGLTLCTPKEADTVIIAGMGGDLICSILDTAEQFFKGGIQLILQPMTRAEVLRYYLIHRGWRIMQEIPLRENGRIFQLFSACYQGVYMRLSDFRDPDLNDWELFTGAYDLICGSDIFDEMVSSESEKIRKKLNGNDQAFYSEILNGLVTMQHRFHKTSSYE